MSHRRTFLSRRGPFVIGAGIALAAGALTVPVVNAATVSGTAAATPSAKRLHDDFNGDGYPDLAIGAPYSKVGGLPTAGAVSVVYGSSSGLSTSRKQVLTWPGRDTSDTPATGYGSGLQSADLDGDGYADLLSSVGVAMMDVDDGCAVVVNWGGPKGLSAIPTTLAWSPSSEWHGQFAVGDVDGDKHPDLVTPGADQWLSDHPDEPKEEDTTVRHGPFTRTGGSPKKDYFTLDPRDSLQNAVFTAGDVTGDGIADLVVSTSDPDEPDSRGTALFTGGKEGFTPRGWLKDTKGRLIGGEDVEIGDLDKDGYGDIVVGHSVDSYDSDVELPTKGGALGVVYGGPGGVSTIRKPVWINQDTAGVPGVGEHGDGMGSGLSVGDTNGDGYLDVATGLPGEDFDGITDAGSVLVLRGSASGLTGTGAKSFSQNTRGVPGTAEKQDRFGAETALLDANADKKDGLIVGDPAENAGNGSLWVFSAGSGGIGASGSFSFGAATLGAPSAGARFGAAVGD
ncbi:FG-GAP-like repeat-containing protein [Streptomyces sp. NPDC058251]|uniref:FG-GAP-like repeat-containing protein n=1 Tax=Streptomyces sp. NPDC058251 TaxID=3346404 RepID=UPI0036E4AE65